MSLSGEESYLRYTDITTENLQLTLKFKTSKPDGLLFVYVSRTQTAAMSDSISLSLIKGKMFFIRLFSWVIFGFLENNKDIMLPTINVKVRMDGFLCVW